MTHSQRLTSGNDETVECALRRVNPAEAEAPKNPEEVGVRLVLWAVHEEGGDGGDASPPDEGQHVALVSADLLSELREEDRSRDGAY